MQIIVKKPNVQEIAEMQKKPVWGCEVSEFDWYYDSEETCLLIEGEVEVRYSEGKVNITAGDMVIFPKGLSCVWNVTKPVSKYYEFK